MKFVLYFSNNCATKYRGNEYSLSIQDIYDGDINENKWTDADDAKQDYYYFHRKIPKTMQPYYYGKSLFVEEKVGEKLREAWKSKFYTESSLNPHSCTPILKIKLLKNPQEYKGDEFEGLSKFCSCTDACPTKEEQSKNGLPEEQTFKQMSIEKKFLIIILAVAGGIVFLIIVGLALKNLKNRTKFRGP